MNRELFRDARYAPEVSKLVLTLNIGKIRFKVREPYKMTIMIPTVAEAEEFLNTVGLGDLPFICLGNSSSVKLDSPIPLVKDNNTTGLDNAQESSGIGEPIYGLLKSIGSFGGKPEPRDDSHPDGFGGDCYGELSNNQCPLCAYQPGDDAPEDDYPWLQVSKDV